MTEERDGESVGGGRPSDRAEANANERVVEASCVRITVDAGPAPGAGARAAAVRREMRYVIAAFGYFTRVPIPRAIALDSRSLAGAARYFPLVGVFVGSAGALVYLAALLAYPSTVAVLLSMAATLLLTGALHEDGLADCCDGLGGAATRDDALRIMRDPRLGAFGAIGLVMALALKWQTLAALPAATAAWTMVSAHAASRALAASFLATHDYAREEGKAKSVAQRMSMRSLAAAFALGLPWLLLLGWAGAAVGLAVLAALRLLLGRYFTRRLGGYTGDCLGLAQQVFELAFYLCALAWISF